MMSQPKILIAEDHSLTRQALVASLKSLGFHNISTATNNEKALQIIAIEKEIDILICSLTTSSAQKLSFMRQASECGTINSMLLISDISTELTLAVAQLASHAGYNLLGIMQKPLNRTELKSVLSAYKPKHPTDTEFSVIELPSGNDIASSLNKNEFTPYYQPKIDLYTGKLVGAEILMRWNHPQMGMLSPAAFIGVAKHFDHLDALTFKVLSEAIRFIATQNFGTNFKLAVNIDAEQLANPTFYEKMAALLKLEKTDPSNIIIEITERGFLASPAICMENLIRLRMLGCGISIDDFGAGFSSLQRICDLPCTEIKMDISFTKSLVHNERSAAAVEAMVRFTNTIGAQLVIEGIETEEQFAAFQELNCHVGQGYFISPPVHGKKLSEWVVSQRSFGPAQHHLNESR